MADDLRGKQMTALTEKASVADGDFALSTTGNDPILRKVTWENIFECVKEKVKGWEFEELKTAAKTLIDAINELNTNTKDSGWIQASMTSSFEAYQSGSQPRYKKQGNRVYIMGIVKPKTELAASDNTVVFTLPEGYRPETMERVFVCQGSSKNTYNLRVLTGGNVRIERYGTTASANIPTSAWLPFYVDFAI